MKVAPFATSGSRHATCCHRPQTVAFENSPDQDPVFQTLRAIPSLPWLNALKIVERASGSSPMPVSGISTKIRLVSFFREVTGISPPSGVKLEAFFLPCAVRSGKYPERTASGHGFDDQALRSDFSDQRSDAA